MVNKKSFAFNSGGDFLNRDYAQKHKGQTIQYDRCKNHRAETFHKGSILLHYSNKKPRL